MRRTTPFAALAVVVALVVVTSSGCNVGSITPIAQSVVQMANLVISGSANYANWGADTQVILQILNAAGVAVPQERAALAVFLARVAQEIIAIATGQPLPAAASHRKGAPRYAAGPRSQADVDAWVKIGLTRDDRGRTLVEVIGSHAKDGDRGLKAAFHVGG
jgi:hypothetical protein